jgi:hypothetical protein
VTVIEQPTLFEVPPNYKEMPLEERFWFFRASNGPLMAHIEEMALRTAADGRRVSVKLLFELVRAEARREPGSEYQLNNDFTAVCARWLIERHPHLADFIELRKSKLDKETR